MGSPDRMEYMRWMVLMHTCECGSMVGEASRWTLYSSVNLRASSGGV